MTALASIGKDPRAIFEFVREKIRFEPYDGVLRGADGTLMALAGNSWDQAVLLSTMLRAAGHATRFARGTLSAAEASPLLMDFTQVPATPPATVPVVLDERRKQFLEEIQDQTSAQAKLVQGALASADRSAATTAQLKIADILEDHAWVQLQQFPSTPVPSHTRT